METKKIEKIYKDLAENGFKCKAIENGIRVESGAPGVTKATFDVYIFDPKQELKDKKEIHPSDMEKDRNMPVGYHFGCRGEKHLYMAKIYSSELANARKNYLEAGKTVELLYSVDLKMFRQSLDKIGLSRSGIIRLSLTRIYRAAVDSDTLITALSDEADIIVKAGKQQAVKNLKLNVKDPFLKKVVCLLCDTILIKTG